MSINSKFLLIVCIMSQTIYPVTVTNKTIITNQLNKPLIIRLVAFKPDNDKAYLESFRNILRYSVVSLKSNEKVEIDQSFFTHFAVSSAPCNFSSHFYAPLVGGSMKINTEASEGKFELFATPMYVQAKEKRRHALGRMILNSNNNNCSYASFGVMAGVAACITCFAVKKLILSGTGYSDEPVRDK